MSKDPKRFTPASREDLIHAVTHAMLFDGRKRTHHWDRINARVAAEKLIDQLHTANYVIMRGPALPAHSGDTRFRPETEGDPG